MEPRIEPLEYRRLKKGTIIFSSKVPKYGHCIVLKKLNSGLGKRRGVRWTIPMSLRVLTGEGKILNISPAQFDDWKMVDAPLK